MANRWGNNGNSDRLCFWGSKLIANGDCSHEIKRCLLLGRKVMTNLDSLLKSKDITLPTKMCLVKALVFPVVMYGCESWTIKKVEGWRIDAFELWCWRRLLSPLDCKEIQPVHCSMSGSNCYFSTCIQVSQEEDKVVWYSHLFKNFPQ